jgi:hypothetical protein
MHFVVLCIHRFRRGLLNIRGRSFRLFGHRRIFPCILVMRVLLRSTFWAKRERESEREGE